MPGVIGIDVSAAKLDVAYLNGTQPAELHQFDQSAEGHRKLSKFAKKRRVQAIVLEATGIYFLDAAMALHDAGLPVSVINPRSAHHFARVLLERTKTDRIDAVILAEYARRMDLTPWQAPDPRWLALRDLARRINRLGHLRVGEKNRLHAYSSKQHTAPALIADTTDAIAQLDARIERLAEAARELIAQDPELTREYRLLTSATGVAETSAVAILGEMCLLSPELRSPQVSRYAGLDVRLSQSGTSTQRPGRLSKAGNAYLRSALHMPALSFVQHDPRARAHYQQLIGRGRKKIQALCAIQRKLLTGLWACIRTDQPFDSAKLFAIEPEQT